MLHGSRLKERPLRTWLFVPGHRRNMVEGAPRHGADVIILDLEESVHPEKRSEAWSIVGSALSEGYAGATPVFVRVRAMNQGGEEDLAALAGLRVTGFLVPKVESVQSVRGFVSSINAHARVEASRVALVPMCESPAGLLAVQEILACPQVIGVALGGEDYLSQLGVTHTSEGFELLFPRAQVALAARALGKVAVDTVYINFRDPAGLRADALRGRQLGFHGKMVIHPDQIPIVREVYLPTPQQIAWARRVVEAAERAEQTRANVMVVDGEMIDGPVVVQARTILSTAETDTCRQSRIDE